MQFRQSAAQDDSFDKIKYTYPKSADGTPQGIIPVVDVYHIV